MNRLNQKYTDVVVPNLMKKFNYKSVMEVPYVDKIVINMGIGEAIANPKVLDEAVAELDRLQLSQEQRNLSQTSNCVKVCLSDVR